MKHSKIKFAHMKYEEISALLDRYWEGESSLEDERAIKAYFQSGMVDERLATLAPLFQAIKQEQALQYPVKAKNASMRPRIYHWAIAASVALLIGAGWWMLRDPKPLSNDAGLATTKPKTDTLPENKQPAITKPENHIDQSKEALAERPIPKKKRKPKAQADPEIDPETAQAMAEIKAALALVSSKLGKGRSQAIKGARYLESVEHKLPRNDG
jgi:hypothetical protein